MRWPSLVLIAVFASSPWPCLLSHAQEAPGPKTLENLLTPDDAPKRLPDTKDQVADSHPARPGGTLVRPEEGVKHPDLDKAWADYDFKVNEAAVNLREAIATQRRLAREAGDATTAKRYRKILEAFDAGGDLPLDDKLIDKPVRAARDIFRTAVEGLQRAYTKVEIAIAKDLTRPEEDAEAVRAEMDALSTGSTPVRQPQSGNVLAAVKLARDKISGDWERINDDELVVHNDNGCARLCLPVELPNEYEVRIVFTRNWGNQGFGLFATRGQAAFLIQVSAADGQAACLNEIRGGPACSVRSPDLGNGRHELVVAVRDQNVSATFDNRLLFKQKTDYTNLTEDRYGFVGPCRLGLISWFNDVTFHRVEIRNLVR